MDSLPPALYKYFGPDRVDVIRSCLVRYSPLGAFNDPFEGQPEVTALATAKNTSKFLDAILPEEASTAYGQMPAETRAVLPYEMWEQLIGQCMKNKGPELLQAMNALTPAVQSLINRKFDGLLGAFCLSEVPDSLLMWSHYGASHTGFALAFDARHPYFHEALGSEDEFRHLRRVMYRDARPSAALTEFDGSDFFLVKSGHWSYEREWRIFRPLPEAHVIYPGDPFDVHLFRFPPLALQAVILGARSTPQTVEAIDVAIRTNDVLSHVQVKRAKPDHSHFLLRILDFSS